MNDRLKAWIEFTDGKCDEGTQLLIDDIKSLENQNADLFEVIRHCVEDVIYISPAEYRNTECLSLVNDILEQALAKFSSDESKDSEK